MESFMIYTGNHLFHYTNFESALRIITTNSLKFGDFKEMNDIAEVSREVFSMVPDSIVYKALANYQSISLTLDAPSRRGFSIDPLWGHYAQKGNGVCLVFDKDKLTCNLKKQFSNRAQIAPIKYLTNFTNAIFLDSHSEREIRKFIVNNIDDIFFTKSIDWEYEHEMRILVRNNKKRKNFNYGKDSLTAIILCLPTSMDYKATSEFKILKAICPDMPILHYTTMLGNKELLNEEGDRTCEIIGMD